MHGCSDDTGALGAEALALAESDDDPAPLLGVRDGEVLEGASRLAAVEQMLQRAVGYVVGDVLAVEDADDDRVGVGRERGVGRGDDAHRPQVTRR